MIRGSCQVCRKREFVLSALIAARDLSRPKHIMDKLRAKVEHRPLPLVFVAASSVSSRL